MKKEFILLIAFIILVFLIVPLYIFASSHSNISKINEEHWAWNDVIGWIDFLYEDNKNVEVRSLYLTGQASSSVGIIALNCADTPNGDVCNGPAGDWRVANDAAGGLSGWAWNEVIGWISFCGNKIEGSILGGGCPLNPTYQVRIKTGLGPTQGDFTGWAWNDVIGWISFNCDHLNDNPQIQSPFQSCSPPTNPAVSYKVKTSWTPPLLGLPTGDLTSSIFDTCPDLEQGDCYTTLNTIMWRGYDPLPSGDIKFVKFLIATECVNGLEVPPYCSDWKFVGPTGVGSFYGPARSDEIVKLNSLQHKYIKYFRYKVFLTPCDFTNGCEIAVSPVIDEIIINRTP